MRKALTAVGSLGGFLLAAPTALADTDPAAAAPTASNPIGWIALIVALLALAAAVVLYLGVRRALEQAHEENAALQRRLREMEAGMSRQKNSEPAPSGLEARLDSLERAVEDLNGALQSLERSARAAQAFRPTVPQQPTYSGGRTTPPAPAAPSRAAAPTQAAAPQRVPQSFARPAVSAAKSDEIERMNRVLDGSDSPERALQKLFSPQELGRMEFLHYVRPQLKMQDAGYAQFCAYTRVNPSNVSLIKMGSYVVPSKLSLNASAIADWYEITRRSDPENAAPHMVILEPATAREESETVTNESHESKRLITVEKKGRLLACNL